MRRRARPDAGAVSQGPPPPALARQGASGPALRWPRGPLSRAKPSGGVGEVGRATALRNAVAASAERAKKRRREQSFARGARLGPAGRWCLLDLLRALRWTRGCRQAPRAPLSGDHEDENDEAAPLGRGPRR